MLGEGSFLPVPLLPVNDIKSTVLVFIEHLLGATAPALHIHYLIDCSPLPSKVDAVLLFHR